MPVHYDKGKGRWRFQFNRVIPGRGRQRASRLLPAAWSRAKAEEYARKEEGRLYAIATGVEQQRFLIDDAVALYVKHRTTKQRAGHKARLHLAALLPYYESRPLSELAAVAREFAEADHGLASGTVHNRLAYLKAACRYAWRAHWKPAGLLEHDPAAGMEIPPANNERHVYARFAQLKKLWASFDDPEDRAVFRIAFYAGLRWMADLLPRQPSDVVRQGRALWLNLGTTKNGAPIMKPIHPAIRSDLDYLPFEKHWRTYYAGFERARKKAGLEAHTAHDLRHSLASILLDSGRSLSDVQGALHQKTAAAANRYAHLYPERLQTALFSVGKSPKRAHRKAKRTNKKAA